MKTYHFTVPLMKGSVQSFEIIDERARPVAKLRRYYAGRFKRFLDFIIDGWDVNLQAVQGDRTYCFKELFRWLSYEWCISSNGDSVGSFHYIKKFELGSTYELNFESRKYVYTDRMMETKSYLHNDKQEVIAIVDYKMFDMTRRKVLQVYREEIPVPILVCIHYISNLKKR